MSTPTWPASTQCLPQKFVDSIDAANLILKCFGTKQKGGNTMEIILNKEAPLELVRVIDELKNYETGVERVIIDAFIPGLNSIGAYELTTKTVLIDLGHCLTDTKWMDYGMLLIPNAWLNMLIAVYHEFSHACQLLEDPTLDDIGDDIDLLTLVEEEATAEAMKEATAYFDNGGKVPPLKEMGWIGENLARTLNNIYSKVPEQVMEEVSALQVGAVARVETVTASHPGFNENSIQVLNENVEEGQSGVKMNGRGYLTMSEFLAIPTGANYNTQEV